MLHTNTISILSILALTAACAAEDPLASTGPGASPEPPTEAPGAGGSGPEMPGPEEPEGPTSYEMAIGAAYANSGDARIVLIDATGTRSVLYNPSSGTFESADDIDELEGGTPLLDVAASANVGTDTYLFDESGHVTVYDRDQAMFSPPELLAEVLDDVPFAGVGAAFGAGDTLFVFNEGGSRYAAYDTAADTWSPIYDFITDFGGGGAPIPSVGAAYVSGNSYVLFDKSGTSYCIYSGGGEFSDDFDIEDLGDGTLTFNDD